MKRDFALIGHGHTLASLGVTEELQDIIGLFIADSTSIDFTYNDAGNSLSGAVITANPTGTIGLAAVNGTAATPMRSDAAPALSQAITPTWTNVHTFSQVPVVPNDSWAYAKIQNVSASSRVLGRITSGAGDIEELTGANLTTIIGGSALTRTDDTNVTLTLGGTPATALLAAASLTLGWTGTLAKTRGGFGLDASSLTGYVKAAGAGAMTASATIPYSDLTGTPSIPAAANPTASLGLSAVNGSASTYLRSDGAPALSQAIAPTWTQTHTFNNTPVVPNDSWTYAKIQDVSATSRVLGRITAGAGDIEELTGANLATIIGTSLGANPSASIGLTAVNGSAGTYMRSDGAPALSQSIAPVWSGMHVFGGTMPTSTPANSGVYPGLSNSNVGEIRIVTLGGISGERVSVFESRSDVPMFRIRFVADDFSTTAAVLQANRSGVGVSSIDYGNTTDLPPHNFSGQVRTTASTTGVASLRVPHGTAPSSPVNGDIWTTTAGLFVRINGATVGPLS